MKALKTALATVSASLASAFFMVNNAMAAETAGELLGRVQSGNFETFLKFATGGMFIAGVVFIGLAGWKIKQVGVQSQAAQAVSLKNPVLQFVSGVALVYLTVFVGVGGQTIFGDSTKNTTISGQTTIE